jgi:hypothetical protein
MQYGRLDSNEEQVGDTSGLPAGNKPFPQEQTAAEHLRWVFGRMGLTDQEMVALSGGHTLGRAFKNRSGAASTLLLAYKLSAMCFVLGLNGRDKYSSSACLVQAASHILDWCITLWVVVGNRISMCTSKA